MGAYPQYGHMIVQDLHEPAVLTQFKHFRAERRLHRRFGHRKRACRAGSSEPLKGVQDQIHFGCNARQFVKRIECPGVELLRGVEEQLLRPARTVVFSQFLLHGLERTLFTLPNLVEADDVVAELRLHGPPNLIEFHGEYGILKGARTPAQPTEVTALGAGTGILGEFGSKVLERFAGVKARQDIRGACLSLGIVLG